MKRLRWNSFIAGFTTAVLLFALGFVLTQVKMKGGFQANAPDGQVSLHASGPLGGGNGCTYDFELVDRNSNSVLRRAEISFAANQHTSGLRGSEGDAKWDPQSEYVDIIIAGDSAMRLWVPRVKNTEQTEPSGS